MTGRVSDTRRVDSGCVSLLRYPVMDRKSCMPPPWYTLPPLAIGVDIDAYRFPCIRNVSPRDVVDRNAVRFPVGAFRPFRIARYLRPPVPEGESP